MNGYEQIYQQLLPRLADCNLAECAARMGFVITASGEVEADFCGTRYLISRQGVRRGDGSPVDASSRTELNSCSLLIHYLRSEGTALRDEGFVLSHQLTSNRVAGQKPTADSSPELLQRLFGGDTEKLERAVLRLGGHREQSDSELPTCGQRRWRFELLPRVHAQIVLHDADEDFPAELQLKLSANAREFLDHECLAVLTSCLLALLRREAEQE